MRSPLLIGLCGAAGSGKDLAVAPLVDQGWVVVKCADPLWEALEAMDLMVFYLGCYVNLNGVIAKLGREETKRQVPVVRGYLQRLGTEVGRDMISPYVWANILSDRLADKFDAEISVAVTDVRFEEEAEVLGYHGGKLIRIERPGVEPLDHKSEHQQLEYDWTIVNDGTVAKLHRAVLNYVESL